MNYVEIAQSTITERYPMIVYAKPDMHELPAGTIMGTWHYSIPGKIRYILNREMEVARGVMPADVTRAYVHDAFKLPIKLRRSQVEGKGWPLPLFSDKGQHGHCSYVDIKAAYLKILGFGYDLEYERNKYVGVNFSKVPDEIAKNKMCYAVAVAMSASRKTNIQVMGKEGPGHVKGFNIYSNPCLYNLATDILASIASEVLRVFGPIVKYVNTDGYIIETKYAQTLIDIIASWGFESRVKYEGLTEVYGVAAWKIGEKRTRRFNVNALNFKSDMPDKEQSVWLKRRVAKLNNCAIIRFDK